MKVQRIYMQNMDSFSAFMNSEFQQDTLNFELNGVWNKGNVLRIYHYNTDIIEAVIRRGIDSGIRTDIPVGTLLTSGVIEDKVYIWDDPYWSVRFGKSCLLCEDAPPYQLFMEGTKGRIHPRNTEANLLSKIALRNVLKRMYDIDIELYTDADIYLLPSRNKFSCGFSRAIYTTEEKFDDDVPMIRYEVGWVTFWMDHEMFQRILPEWEYTRENSSDPNHAGINGIKNEFPEFNREEFEPEWILEMATLLEDDPVVEYLEDVYL